MSKNNGITWLNVKQLAERFGLSSPASTRNFVYRQGVPYYKMGRGLRFRLDEVDAWLATKKQVGIDDVPPPEV